MKRIFSLFTSFLILFGLLGPNGIATITSFTSTFAQEESPFFDVDPEDEYVEDIRYLKDNEIVQGYQISETITEDPDAERQFRPDYELNRAELTKIMVEAVFTDEEINACIEDKQLKDWQTVYFPDVNIDAWFAKYICIAVEKGLIDGYPDGTFKPAEAVNFAEAAKIVANARGLQGSASSDDDWFTPFVRALENENGIPPSIRSFGKFITRGEMARMIHAALESINTDSLALTELQQLNERDDELPQIDSCNALIETLNLDVPPPVAMPMMRSETMDFMEGDADFGEGAGTTGSIAETEEAASEPATLDGASDDFSQTNVQVEGVDEADIVKNDGKFIYLIKGSTIRIVEAYPAQNLEELSTIEVDDENFNPIEMYIDEDQMVIIGNVWKQRYYPRPIPLIEEEPSGEELAIWPDPGFNQNRMKVYIYDISDRNNPSKQRSIEIEGDYSNSRKVGKNLYFVINQWIPYYNITDDMPADMIIPRFKDSATGNVERPLERCMDVLYFPRFQDRNYLIVAGLDISDTNAELNRKVLIGSSQNIYASRSSLYVATPDYGEVILEDEADLFVGSESRTKVYRFTLNQDQIEYQNQGIVPGNILNQFSMDESRGHFRIATTRDYYNDIRGYVTDNNLYILNADSMQLTGKIEQIAPDERIKSVRFMGNRGYMVTFETVDPLFVLDLRDPANPSILGKLKIPGWSDYLHPYDENHLLGFGREVDPRAEDADRLTSEYLLGMKLSIFDVSDVSNPQEIHKEVIGARGTTSELLRNHKALLFDREKNLLAFPIAITEDKLRKDCQQYSVNSCPAGCDLYAKDPDGVSENTVECLNPLPGYDDISTVFSGAIVYNVDLENGFQEQGKVTHYQDDSVFEDSGEYFYGEIGRNIQRMLYIGEYLYSVSPDFVRSYMLDTVEPINFIQLSGPRSDDVYYLDDVLF